MTYYDNDLLWFRVDGKNRRLTEQQAESLADDGHDIVALEDLVDEPWPDELADEYLYCTCGPDLPDGRTGKVCLMHSRVATNDEVIPFEF